MSVGARAYIPNDQRLDRLEQRIQALEEGLPVKFGDYVKQRTWAYATDIVRAWFKFHKVLRSGTLGRETDYYYTDESYRMAIFRLVRTRELIAVGWGVYIYNYNSPPVKSSVRLTEEERAVIAQNTTESTGALARQYGVSWDTIRRIRPVSPYKAGRS